MAAWRAGCGRPATAGPRRRLSARRGRAGRAAVPLVGCCGCRCGVARRLYRPRLRRGRRSRLAAAAAWNACGGRLRRRASHAGLRAPGFCTGDGLRRRLRRSAAGVVGRARAVDRRTASARRRRAADWPNSPPTPRNHARSTPEGESFTDARYAARRPGRMVADFRRAAHDFSTASARIRGRNVAD